MYCFKQIKVTRLHLSSPVEQSKQNYQGLIAPFISRSVVPLLSQPCRYAGGGGRPGGKPTFNWKERRALNLDVLSKRKEFKVKPFGNFDELKPFFDEKVGDMTIDLKKVESFDDTTYFPQNLDEMDSDNLFKGENNTRKVMQMSLLFGSKKPYGMFTKPIDQKKLAKRLKYGKQPLKA